MVPTRLATELLENRPFLVRWICPAVSRARRRLLPRFLLRCLPRRAARLAAIMRRVAARCLALRFFRGMGFFLDASAWSTGARVAAAWSGAFRRPRSSRAESLTATNAGYARLAH